MVPATVPCCVTANAININEVKFVCACKYIMHSLVYYLLPRGLIGELKKKIELVLNVLLLCRPNMAN